MSNDEKIIICNIHYNIIYQCSILKIHDIGTQVLLVLSTVNIRHSRIGEGV